MKTCELPGCDNTIPELRASKGAKTCGKECASIVNANRQAVKRAKEKCCGIIACKGKGCCRIVVVSELGAKGLCYWCKAKAGLRKQIKRKPKPITLKDGGELRINRDPLVYDSRTHICERKGFGKCDGFSECLDVLCHDRKARLKCDVEGVDCWHQTPKADRGNYGTQLTGSHVIRFS